MLRKTPHLAVAAKAKAGASALDQDFADQHPSAIPDIDAIAAGGIDITHHVALDTVRGTRIGVGEHAPVAQIRLIVFPKDGEGVDGGGTTRFAGVRAMEQVGVGDVDGVLAGGKTEAAGTTEAVGDDSDVPRGRIEAVDLLWKLGLGPKAVLVAVDGVGEPHGTVGGHHDVAGGVKWPGMIIVEEGDRLMWSLGFHVDQPGGFFQRALRAQDQPVAVIRATTGHEISFRASDLVAREIRRGEELDFCDDDSLVMGRDRVRRCVRKLVRGDEESVGVRMEDARFVEKGGAWIVDQELQGGSRAEEGEEGVVVNEERLGLWGDEGGRGDSSSGFQRESVGGRRGHEEHTAIVPRFDDSLVASCDRPARAFAVGLIARREKARRSWRPRRMTVCRYPACPMRIYWSRRKRLWKVIGQQFLASVET